MLRVTSPGPNDDLPPRCGINVMLVLDESGSIASSNATEAVRSATRAFLDALSGTGASVAITDFSTTAQLQVDYTTVTPESVANVFDPYIDDRYDPNGWTNWQAAFDTVHASNAKPGGKKADLVVFITDGDPTARNTADRTADGPDGGRRGGAGAGRREADLVKEQGSHVFALGVGAAVTKPTSARRLTAVSGFDQFPEEDFEKADYTLVEDFDDLAQALRDIAIALCRASVTVTKQVDEGDGVFRPAAGWDFTADVTVPGGYAWTQPDPPPSTGPRTQTTNVDGVATFQWQPQDSSATSTVTLTEVREAGLRVRGLHVHEERPGPDADAHAARRGLRQHRRRHARPERVRQVHGAQPACAARARHDPDHQGRGARQLEGVQLHRRAAHRRVRPLGRRRAGSPHVPGLQRPAGDLRRAGDAAGHQPPLGTASDVGVRGDHLQQAGIPGGRVPGVDHGRPGRGRELHLPERARRRATAGPAGTA